MARNDKGKGVEGGLNGDELMIWGEMTVKGRLSESKK